MGTVCTYSVSANRLRPETVAKVFCFGETMSKSIKDYMIIWTTTGEVGLQLFPSNGRLFKNGWEKAWGACNAEVVKADFETRKALVFIQAVHMIVRDKCDSGLVHSVLSELEEYQDGCSDDMPGFSKSRNLIWW